VTHPHALLVTRPAPQAAELSLALRHHRIEPVEVPAVAIDTTATAAALDELLATLGRVDWLVLTSANGARALVARMRATQRRLPDGVRVAAVGPATAGVLLAAGLRVDHVPDRYLTVAIADGLGDVRGRRVVLARADAATPDLHDALVRRGAKVAEIVAYRTVEGPPESVAPLRAALGRTLAGASFTSGSTVRGLVGLAGARDRQRVRELPAFCIGPVTAAAAERAGFHVAAVADEHTAAGLAGVISTHFAMEAR
jgi:uroporphyrinogen-III synthase